MYFLLSNSKWLILGMKMKQCLDVITIILEPQRWTVSFKLVSICYAMYKSMQLTPKFVPPIWILPLLLGFVVHHHDYGKECTTFLIIFVWPFVPMHTISGPSMEGLVHFHFKPFPLATEVSPLGWKTGCHLNPLLPRLFPFKLIIVKTTMEH